MHFVHFSANLLGNFRLMVGGSLYKFSHGFSKHFQTLGLLIVFFRTFTNLNLHSMHQTCTMMRGDGELST